MIELEEEKRFGRLMFKELVLCLGNTLARVIVG